MMRAARDRSAPAARRLVNRFIADELGYLLRAGEPTLAVSDRAFWRVPILLATPDAGLLGEAGTIDVDAATGRIVATPEQLAAINRRAEDLANAHTTRSRP
jgi:hypothetical protein